MRPEDTIEVLILGPSETYPVGNDNDHRDSVVIDVGSKEVGFTVEGWFDAPDDWVITYAYIDAIYIMDQRIDISESFEDIELLLSERTTQALLNAPANIRWLG